MFLLDDLAAVASAVSIAAMAVTAITLSRSVDPLAGLVVPAWGLGLALLASERAAHMALQTRARMTRRSHRPALIVGAGRVGAHIARRLSASPEYGLQPIGFLDWDPLPTAGVDHGPPLVGTPTSFVRSFGHAA